MTPYLVMEGITRYYTQSGILANDHVYFSLEKGEIHALAGENGAGKTTLMKILYGLEKKDEGRIIINGEEADIKNPLDAGRYGIGMVRQHLRLIREFTVAENCVLGIEPRGRGFAFDRKRAVRNVEKVIRENGFELSPDIPVKDLSVGMQQQAAIVRMLYRNDDLLILDEPTSVLTRRQRENLFRILKDLVKKRGKTVILITHKPGEIKEAADRITIMRKGRIEGTFRTGDIDEKEISRIMVGREITFPSVRRRYSGSGDKVLELKNISLSRGDVHRPLLAGIDLEVERGEILGIAGVSGNGVMELEDIVSGLVFPSGGTVVMNGRDVTSLPAAGRRKTGFAYVPSDRMGRGSCPEASVMENITAVHRDKLFKYGMFLRGKAVSFGKRLLSRFSVKADLKMPVKTLSGGNIQKLILSRELSVDSDFILFSGPSRGLDIASESYVYRKIIECGERGKGVLLLSTDLDEIMSLSTRIAVIYQGRITGVFLNDGSLSKEDIGDYMLGLKSDIQA